MPGYIHTSQNERHVDILMTVNFAYGENGEA